jgi:plasmid stability protein
MKPIQVYITEEDHKALKVKAAHLEVTVSDIIRDWINYGLESDKIQAPTAVAVGTSLMNKAQATPAPTTTNENELVIEDTNDWGA